jgi:AcrR family transcriptional regulator
MVTDSSSENIRSALLSLLADRSYAELGLADLLRAAAVSEPEFTVRFASLDDCFSELYQGFMREAAGETFAAYAAEGDWRSGMRAQIWASHDFLVADPLRARIAVIDVNSGGEAVLAIRDLFMGAFIELVHLGRHGSAAAGEVPRERAEAIAGASWELIAQPIRAGRLELLVDVVPQILYLLYLPYLGEAEARAELVRARQDAARRLTR